MLLLLSLLLVSLVVLVVVLVLGLLDHVGNVHRIIVHRCRQRPSGGGHDL